MTEKAAQLQSYNQDLVKCKSLENVYAIFCLCLIVVIETFFFLFPDIEVLKRKKMKTEIDIATDEKNKETIANQIRMLNDKLEEIEARQHAKKKALAKIEDTLTQSEIGKMIFHLNEMKLDSSMLFSRIFKDHRLTSSSTQLRRLKD